MRGRWRMVVSAPRMPAVTTTLWVWTMSGRNRVDGAAQRAHALDDGQRRAAEQRDRVELRARARHPVRPVARHGGDRGRLAVAGAVGCQLQRHPLGAALAHHRDHLHDPHPFRSIDQPVGSALHVRLGVFTVLYSGTPFEEVLDRLAGLGVQAVELGTGGHPGTAHCDPDELLADESKVRALRRAVESRGMVISALSQHANPLHPDAAVARTAHETWRKTAQLAGLLEVSVVNAFSGCPGDHDGAVHPNWVTSPWPPEYSDILEWQWTEKVIPYWSDEAAFARSAGVRIALEMHPGFVVYNNESLFRLRDAAGPEIGANFDPSHLFWQQADPVEAIKELGAAGALFHVHAKDTYVDRGNVVRNGVIDTKDYTRFLERAWTFRTVGYGQGEKVWRDMVSALRMVGYDHVMSIEHEDGLMSVDEGLEKAVAFLSSIMLKDSDQAEMWWA